MPASETGVVDAVEDDEPEYGRRDEPTAESVFAHSGAHHDDEDED